MSDPETTAEPLEPAVPDEPYRRRSCCPDCGNPLFFDDECDVCGWTEPV